MTVIPKCGSTTVRDILAPITTNDLEKPAWQLGHVYHQECGERSWGVVRNPWKRVLSRWREKTEHRDLTLSFREYLASLNHIVADGLPYNPIGSPQSHILGCIPPQWIVDIDAIAEWLPELEAREGVVLGPPIRSRYHGCYDWCQEYRDCPETRDIVREVYAADWDLEFDWEDPLG